MGFCLGIKREDITKNITEEKINMTNVKKHKGHLLNLISAYNIELSTHKNKEIAYKKIHEPVIVEFY